MERNEQENSILKKETQISQTHDVHRLKKVLIHTNLDYKNPWNFFEYIISPLTEKNYLVKFKVSIETELGNDEEEWDEKLLSNIRENVRQIKSELEQHPNNKEFQFEIKYEEVYED